MISDFASLALLSYPQIDPILVEIGPIAIRWYALAYIAGILLAWRYCRWLTTQSPSTLEPKDMDDLLLWATLGVVLGGRLGYIVFYNPGYYLENPLQVLVLWQGGMAFHGGMIGVLLAMYFFARSRGVRYFELADMVGAATPIGLCLGRIANFINGELYGRTTDVPWAMIFPQGGPEPRHPSQLYEAGLEGIVLFLFLWFLVRRGALERVGAISGWFLIGYGLARIFAEFFRQPDVQLGFLAFGTTMGQILSLPMIAAGIVLLVWAQRQPLR
ncbi:MAG: prolipoprotein diacylglyceryl transferase [Rhodovibrionaceae bacterium]